MDSDSPVKNLSDGLAQPPSILRTPSRRQQFTDNEINPLLANLSPTSTLEALVATDAIPSGNRHRRSFIQNSVASASTSERAWGIKAALAGKKLREWQDELSHWVWPGYDNVASQGKEEWAGSFSKQAQDYEERLECIRDDMETLELEDLKTYVRSTHLRSRSSQTSVLGATTDYEHLNDFTAVITATIVQALPALTHLTAMLDIWTTRLLIVRQIPAFTAELTAAQEFKLSAWMAVEKPSITTENLKMRFANHSFLDMQAVFQDQIVQVGARLDNMLDLLEGSQDVLPDRWLQDLEYLEDEYSSWVVKAEELVLAHKMHCKDQEEQKEHKRIKEEYTGRFSEATSSLNLNNEAQQEYNMIGEDNTQDEKHAESESTPTARGVPLQSAPPRGARSFSADLDEHLVDEPTDAIIRTTKPAITAPIPNLNNPRPNRRPPSLVLDRKSPYKAQSDTFPDVEESDSDSAVSDYFSDKSSPEIRNASVIEFVGSPTLVTSPWQDREAFSAPDNKFYPSIRSNMQLPKLTNAGDIDVRLPQHSRASTSFPEMNHDNDVIESVTKLEEPSLSTNLKKPGCASMQSVELSEDGAREITDGGSGSHASASADLKDSMLSSATGPVSIPFSMGSEGPQSSEPIPVHVSGVPGHRENRPQDRDPVSFENKINAPTLPPPRHRFQQTADVGPGLTPVKLRTKAAREATKTTDDEKSHTLRSSVEIASKNSDDQLEARISSILNEIPAPIRLTSGNGTGFPGPHTLVGKNIKYGNQNIAPRMDRAQTSVTLPTMTLAPAQPKSFQSRPSNGEPEVRLYHLHQAGKDAPVKLFIRLVGEAGERVMVRIGGGWADLAEYLKEYASHHGRRSASDARFDIQGIPSSPMSQASSAGSPAHLTPSRPGHAMRQQTTPGKLESPHTPASDPYPRSESRTSWVEEDSPSLGLAGPKTKRVEISPRKQAWVDEMVEQARGGAGGLNIGDIGKVGGTKRVFLKGRSRAGSNV